MEIAESRFDALKLSNQLCFPLYVCSKEVIKKYRPLLDELGLTYTQYITMMALWEEGSLSVKELGDRLYLDSGTLTPLLKSLEDKGYITRCRLESDARVLAVSLTKTGSELREKALPIPSAVAACTNLDKDETRELYGLLYKLIYTLRK